MKATSTPTTWTPRSPAPAATRSLTRSTAKNGVAPRRRVLQLPPLLHRQAEDPRHRRPSGPVRGPLRQEGPTKQTPRRTRPRRPTPTTRSRAPTRAQWAWVGACISTWSPCTTRGGTMFDAVDGMEREHDELERRLGDARDARRRPAGQAAQPALRRAEPDPHRQERVRRRSWRHRRGARARRRGSRRSPTEVDALADRLQDAEEQLRRLLVPRDPTDDKDAILEVKSGEGGEESALFAGDLLRMYSRYAEHRGLEGRRPRRDRVRPRRLQVRHPRDEGQGHVRARPRRRTAC